MIKNKTDISPSIFFAGSKKPQLFQGLSEDSLQHILENSTLQNFPKDQILIQQGDIPEYAYFIVSGQMRSFRSNSDGNEATIRMLEAGDVCMEAVIFMGGTSPITVQTLSDTRIILIPNKFMKSFAVQDTQFANNLLRIVTHHYKNAMHQIDAMATKTPVQRVGYYFLQKHIEQGSDHMDFELPFKKSTIANHLGMTPETFSRALQQIKKIGVEIDGEIIRLKDAYALCHFCDTDTVHDCTLSNKEACPVCPMHKSTAH
ncbi:MAG: Crp/Fnr family transcriptional regulator [Alphaproteobacteria bacterium]